MRAMLLEVRRADDGGAGDGDGGVDLRDFLGTRDRGPRIRCPKCRWEPRSHDRWQCECLHVWNTFDTRGRCPACAKQWRMTQCLRCHALSSHDDWYEER
ncbi:hypothetical protein DB32_005556 [Sandaracinus amylolyticus]|uniref:Uncharacterized protein n=1 Tax=Sandaracinus amylolyticus TaxID=927083 RepID=A0A0F6YJS3_9BACT|nr:hypothetical protein DB32_005556 [Sandaracinus amylolyticus]